MNILDSDSSMFSWRVNDVNQKVRNENFPENYIKHIQENIGKADIILVSSHLQVREAMAKAGIEYVTVYPENSLKEEWLGRCFLRGNDTTFLNFLSGNWDSFMKSICNEPYGKCLYRLSHGQYLSDIIQKIKNN